MPPAKAMFLGLLLVVITQTGCITAARWSEANDSAPLESTLIVASGKDGPHYQAIYQVPNYGGGEWFGHAFVYELSPADLEALTVTLPPGPAPLIDNKQERRIDDYHLPAKALVRTISLDSAKSL